MASAASIMATSPRVSIIPSASPIVAASQRHHVDQPTLYPRDGPSQGAARGPAQDPVRPKRSTASATSRASSARESTTVSPAGAGPPGGEATGTAPPQVGQSTHTGGG